MTNAGKDAADDIPSWIGLFDLFRVGIGPSSSHTVGPMIAASRFIAAIPLDMQVQSLQVELFGSLALTGKGHATDTAVVLGLLGERPDRLDPDDVPALVGNVTQRKALDLPGSRTVAFDPARDIVFKRQMLPRHPNAMRCTATSADAVCARTYYSVGGGFIVTDGEEPSGATDAPRVPYPFTTSVELLAMAEDAGLGIAELQRANERSIRSDAQISREIADIWTVMQECVARGLRQGGELPGGLRVRRRAPGLHARLLAREGSNEHDVLHGMDWVNLFALAVNEENAAGGRVVTAPTNGAAGIVPAVLHYYDRFVAGATAQGIETFLR
jgi:L-serine dehydratase